jgi:antitoxin component of MazEF toxin-antitoxin module
MDTVKLGKSGQLSIPRALMRQLGLNGQETLLVEVTPDGAIQLRPAAVFPVELYSAARAESFATEMKVSEATLARIAAAVRKAKTRKKRG